MDDGIPPHPGWAGIASNPRKALSDEIDELRERNRLLEAELERYRSAIAGTRTLFDLLFGDPE